MLFPNLPTVFRLSYLIFTFLFFFSTIGLAQLTPLCGTYTIGGTAPDYETFNAAVDDLTNFGVCGETVFNVRDGVYEEQVRLIEIDGAGEDSRVIFQSESGDSTQVLLTFDAQNVNENFVFYLDGSDWISLKKLSLKSTNGYYAKVIYVGNDANYNKIENNVLEGTLDDSSVNPDYKAIISYDNTVSNDSNQVLNNVILYGTYGVFQPNYVNGNNTSGTKINNNFFRSQRREAISIRNQTNLSICENDIASALGIYVRSSSTDINISFNQIDCSNRCIRLDGVGSNQEDTTFVTNNFIKSSGQHGIFCDGGKNQWICYNTIISDSYNDESSAFYNQYGSDITLMNNIICNYGSGYAIINEGYFYNMLSDYNNLFSNGPFLARNYVNEFSNLEDWQLEIETDRHSLNLDPYFSFPFDTYTPAQNGLNNKALPLSEITTDIDHQLRSMTHPDIGADEFSAPSEDVHLINVSNPTVPFPSGEQAITVRFTNLGEHTLENCNFIFSVNDTLKAPYQWSGSLENGDTATTTVADYYFKTGQSYDLKVFIDAPNGVEDGFHLNDTLKIDSLYAALDGNYTLGGTMPDFETFAHAATTLNQGGVLGAVTFNIRDGIYEEQLSLYDIVGTSESNRVTFQSESADSSAVTLVHSPSEYHYTLKLKGTKYTTFKNITFEKNSSNFRRIVLLTHNHKGLIFENNQFNSIGNQSRPLIEIPETLETYEDLLIRNNRFEGGRYGLWSYEEGKRTRIENNTFINPRQYAINISYEDNLSIIGNIILADEQASHSGISLYRVEGEINIEKNIIKSEVTGGIILRDSEGTVENPVQVKNNFIRIKDGGRGIESIDGFYQNISHNTVWMSGGSTSSTAYYNEGTQYFKVKNNIFFNDGTGTAMRLMYHTPNRQSDYNCLKTLGETLVGSGNSYATLEDWQVSQLDSHSVEVLPYFLNDSTYQVQQFDLNNAGTPLADVSEDIEGEQRNILQPDIGADEFSLPENDAGISDISFTSYPILSGLQNIQGVLRNFGQSPLTSAEIVLTVNESIVNNYTWSGNLASGDTLPILLGELDMSVIEQYDFKAWTRLPNGETDIFNANDTLTLDSIYVGLQGSYTIGGVDPDFEDFSQTCNILKKAGVLGAVVFNARSGIYDENIYLSTVNGTSDVHTITFQSESGDSTDVILTNITNPRTIFTVDGTKWLRLKKMTIANTDIGISINLKTVHDFTIENCLMTGHFSSFSFSEYGAIISDYTSSNLIVRNNHIINADHGLYLKASGNLIVENNYVEGDFSYGLRLTAADVLRVKGNIINADGIEGECTGLSVGSNYALDEAIVAGNQIYGHRITRGMSLHVKGEIDNYINIFNNFIQVTGGDDDHTGMFFLGANYLNIYHNTVHVMADSNPYSRVLHLWDSYFFRFHNNIFYNAGAGRIITSDFRYHDNYSDVIDTSDYNNIYTNGDTYFTGIEFFPTLKEWKESLNFDLNSVSVQPYFEAEDSFRPRQSILNGTGLPLASVIDDIEGDIRDTEFPDIGADEFMPSSYDVGVDSLLLPVQPFAAGERPAHIRFKNYGTETVNQVHLHWSINGIAQPDYLWTGSLVPMEQAIVDIGIFDLNVFQPYEIAVWTSQPNATSDNFIHNDSTWVHGLQVGLGGTYSIGENAADFLNFTTAINALESGGVVDSVIFNIRTGVYEEKLILNEIIGVSEQNTILFQSESGDSTDVTLQYPKSYNDNYVILFDGADRVTFKAMTIKNTGDDDGSLISIVGDSDFNGFEHNLIYGIDSTTNNVTQKIFHFQGRLCNWTSIRNNTILGGNNAIISTDDFESFAGIVIENNYMEGQTYSAILLIGVDSISIQNNFIKSTSSSFAYDAIYLSDSNYNVIVSENKIDLLEGTGIYLSTMYVYDSIFLVKNNMIRIRGNNKINGIKIIYSSNCKIIHNSIAINGNNYSTAFEGYNFHTTDIFNNIFCNYGEGLVLSYGYYAEGHHADYNNLFGNISSNYANLADLQANVTDYEQHSISVNPQFISDEDLHVTNPALNDAGFALDYVLKDIDNEPRNTSMPDIGADEFTPINLGLVGINIPTNSCTFSNAEPLMISIQNHSAENIHQLEIAYQINNEAIVIETLENLDIMPNSIFNHTFTQSLNLSNSGTYVLKTFIANERDYIYHNDTLTTNIQTYPKDSTFTTQYTCLAAEDQTTTETILTNQYGCDSLVTTTYTLDEEAPIARCQNITRYLSEGESIVIHAEDIDNGSTDNCSIMSMSTNVGTFSCENVGENTLTLSVLDALENTANCEAILTIIDDVAPQVICPEQLDISLLENEIQSLSATSLNAGSIDNCSSANLSFAFDKTMIQSSIDLKCDDVGERDILLWVTDEAGNQAMCEVHLTVSIGERDCDCDATQLTFLNAPIMSDVYRADQSIYASGQISSGQNVYFGAGNAIFLNPGFEVALGSDFWGNIESCIEGEDLTEETIDFRTTPSMNTEKFSFDLSISPNPFSTQTTITYTLSQAQTIEIFMHRINGEKVQSILPKQQQSIGQYEWQFDASDLPNGIYWMSMIGELGYETLKVVVVK